MAHRYSTGKGEVLAAQKSDALTDLLSDHPDDEKTGSNATAGFTYQQWWATLAVAELLGTKQDFAVALEVKEDVALLDSSSAPHLVEFCQVKKNEKAGAWTLEQLHATGKAKKSGEVERSTLAKLYGRRLDLHPHTSKLRFVSNVGFKVPVASKKLQNEDCHLFDLEPNHQKPVKAAIAEQLKVDIDKVDFTDVRLHRSNLPMAEQELFVAGKLSQLGEKGLLPFKLECPTIAAHFLASEIRSRASNTSYAFTFEDLKKRIYSRFDALASLAQVAQVAPSARSKLLDAIGILRAERSVGFLATKEIEAEIASACTHAMDRTNLQFRDLVKALASASKSLAHKANATLGELMRNTVEDAKATSPSAMLGLGASYINAVALLVLNDGIDIDVFAAPSSQESEDEE